MDKSPTLLVIWHSRTGASEAMAKAAAAHDAAHLLRAEDVSSADILRAGGYLFVCPENLAALSGAVKEMFDANYYAVLGQIEGRPYATIIAAGSDGEGAQRQALDQQRHADQLLVYLRRRDQLDQQAAEPLAHGIGLAPAER